MLQTGQQLSNVVVPGLICDYDRNEGKLEALLCWAIRGHSNKSFLNSFLQGKQATLKENNNSYSESIGTVIGGKELSYIDSRPSTVFDGTQLVYGNTYKLSNVILVPKGMDDKQSKEFIYEKLAKMIVDKYPIPLEDSWKDFFISRIFDSAVKELRVYGNIPYNNAYIVDINANDIGGALASSFGRQQFIDKFKRAPMIESLWKMIDPEKRFNVKAWQKYLEFFGGKDAFESIEHFHQETLVYAFESFGEKAGEMKESAEKNGIDLYGIPFKSSAIAIAKGEVSFNEDLAVKAFKLVLDNVKSQRHKALAIGGLMEGLGTLDLKTLVKKPKELIAKLQGVAYKPQPGAEGVAIVAAELWLGEDRFREYQSEYLKAMPHIIETSRTYPTESGQIDNGYSWESMDMGNPRGWFLGLETNCCQHLHSAGSSCVLYAARHPKESGMFRVMKKGETIAQSWFWFNQATGDFVFDNIEVLGGEIRDSIFDCYMDFIEKSLKPRKDLFGIKRVSAGLGYNDMDRLNNLPRVNNASKIGDLPGGRGIYSDAGNQALLAEFE
jgi:hypothetical protein